ncbi:hypothetical protein, partial [Paenibacillus sp. NPDC058174]|uniref:hypothetical protein n=1 Tax=Paenibacillus sp. NPDC058174 TaxID=3346366 RepID=UPI0036DB7535
TARAQQEHSKSTARAQQEHSKSTARAQQEHSKSTAKNTASRTRIQLGTELRIEIKNSIIKFHIYSCRLAKQVHENIVFAGTFANYFLKV